MRDNTLKSTGALDRRRFLRLAALAPFLASCPLQAALAADTAAPVLSPDCEIVLAPSLGFIELPEQRILLPAKAEEYIRYGNQHSRRMLTARAVRPDEDLIKACVRDWPGFSARVLRDARPLVSPTAGKDFATRLTPYAAVGLAVKLAADKIRYDPAVAALAGNDDVNGDGAPDGLDADMIGRMRDRETQMLASTSPVLLRERFLIRSRRLDSMALDELYAHGSGVCRHQTMVAMAVFLVLKDQSPKLANLYVSGLASEVDRHQWVMASAVTAERIVITFYDPTASTEDKARSVRTFTDKSGQRRYQGIPSEPELRAALGLPAKAGQ